MFRVIVKDVASLCKNTNLQSTKNYATKEATFEVNRPFKMHRLESSPSSSVTVSREEALDMYTKMQAIRRIETSAGNLYKEKIVRGFCHLYSGQEAVAVGMKNSMREQDNIISAYRVHGWTYLMGVSPYSVLAELTGKQGGCARGKGGSMHMYAPNFYGGNGIVGAQVPLGAGVALACKYKENNGVCMSLYGDGASNQGQVFEAYNIAYLWKLPCIFVCENNGYGMGTSAERSSSNTDYYTRGDVLPGLWIDGMDVLAVREGTRFAIDYALKHGPIVLETATYRYSGHSMSDPGTSYRTRDEVQEVRAKRDPITSFRDRMIESGLATSEELKKIDMDMKKEVDAATAKAKADTEIGVHELTTDIYAMNQQGDVRGVTGDVWLKHTTLNKGVNL
ncbi:unnamed protein product [Diamesa serratosioi]